MRKILVEGSIAADIGRLTAVISELYINQDPVLRALFGDANRSDAHDR
jgi:hypothetical protein